MKKFLIMLLFAAILSGCANEQDVKIPSAYKSIVDGISVFSDGITVQASPEEIKEALLRVTVEAPELFYVSREYRYSYINGKTTVFLNYTMSKTEVEEYLRRFYAECDELSYGLEGLSDKEKALILHDRLISGVEYDEKRSFPLADALLAKKADCEGYAKAYQMLLKRNGIEALFAVGEEHAWVMLRLDGVWYHADPTWNDGDGYISHAYFLQNDTVIKRTHKLSDKFGYVYPKCDGTPHMFFEENGLKADNETCIKNAFETGKNSIEICFPSSLSLNELEKLDGKVNEEARKRELTVIKRIVTKGSFTVVYCFR